MKTIIKKLVLLLVVAFFVATAYAQIPEGFNFQAVARDANGNILTHQSLGVKVNILKGSDTGDVVYSETHSTSTNVTGLIQLVIGEGHASEGQSFSAINFGNDNYFINLAIDPAGGTDYADLGTTRLLSVPYALVAKNVVNGGGGPGEAITNYNLNTSAGDTSFNISATGTKSILGALQIRSETDGENRGIDSRVTTSSGNENSQLSIYGRAEGLGSGTHFGVYGRANGSGGGNNIGTLGYALGTGKYNYGVQGLSSGEGNGDEGENYGEGSINFGLYGSSSGNLWNNTGVEAHAIGTTGKVNFGVHGLSNAGATDSTKNYGVAGRAYGPGKNYGVYGTAWDGVENYAGLFDGEVVINGDLTVNGNINGSTQSSGQNVDSLIISTKPDADNQRSISMYPSHLRMQRENGDFSNIWNNGVQFGNVNDEGIFNWFSKSTMQVAHQDYANGERASGLNPGYFYMDIYKDGSFYVPVELGVQNATDGGRPYFSMSSLAMKEAGKGDLFSIHIINDPNGSDPNGETAEMFLWGDESLNFQIGGQSWNNGDLGFLAMYGSTPDGNGWYYDNANLSVGSDGTDEWGSMTFLKTNIAGQTSQQTILLDGYNGNIDIAGALNQSSDVRLKKDIHTIENALENTLKMRGVSYNWKTDESNENPQIGVIAQEVEKIYPEFVHTDEAGMKSVNYAQMTAVLIEAVKSLNSEIQVLKASNATLQAKVETQNELEVRLTKIEKLLQIESTLHSLAKVSIDK
ncbi:MAG: tail fiber domain-containing protein [Balneolaceae bacterium]